MNDDAVRMIICAVFLSVGGCVALDSLSHVAATIAATALCFAGAALLVWRALRG